MFRNNIFQILSFCSLCASWTAVSAEVIFSDSFESGDMSTTNADGFVWDGNNKTGIVTEDPANGSVLLFENKTRYEVLSDLMPDKSDRDYTAKDGKNALRFRYEAGSAWTEQRFDFGKGYPEIWFSYHIRVPLNYDRGGNPDNNPNTNNKWMIFLMAPMDRYSNPDVSWVEVKDRPNSDGESMNMMLQIHNGVNHTYTPESTAYPKFITPADKGRWMQIIYHLKASSDNKTSDGAVRMYRKWDDEPAFKYIAGYENEDIGIGAGSIASNYLGWGAGYFMGYANDPYPKETEWLIDDFILSDTSLLPNPPRPPAIIGVTKITPK